MYFHHILCNIKNSTIIPELIYNTIRDILSDGVTNIDNLSTIILFSDILESEKIHHKIVDGYEVRLEDESSISSPRYYIDVDGDLYDPSLLDEQAILTKILPLQEELDHRDKVKKCEVLWTLENHWKYWNYVDNEIYLFRSTVLIQYQLRKYRLSPLRINICYNEIIDIVDNELLYLNLGFCSLLRSLLISELLKKKKVDHKIRSGYLITVIGAVSYFFIEFSNGSIANTGNDIPEMWRMYKILGYAIMDKLIEGTPLHSEEDNVVKCNKQEEVLEEINSDYNKYWKIVPPYLLEIKKRVFEKVR